MAAYKAPNGLHLDVFSSVSKYTARHLGCCGLQGNAIAGRLERNLDENFACGVRSRPMRSH